MAEDEAGSVPIWIYNIATDTKRLATQADADMIKMWENSPVSLLGKFIARYDPPDNDW